MGILRDGNVDTILSVWAMKVGKFIDIFNEIASYVRTFGTASLRFLESTIFDAPLWEGYY